VLFISTIIVADHIGKRGRNIEIKQNKKTFCFTVYLTPLPPLLKKERGEGRRLIVQLIFLTN